MFCFRDTYVNILIKHLSNLVNTKTLILWKIHYIYIYIKKSLLYIISNFQITKNVTEEV